MEYTLGTKLYKTDSKGKTREWSINVRPNGQYFDIVTIAGIQGGKMIDSIVTITSGKNIGKANETSVEQQAINEALASAELKLRGEYNFELSDKPQTLRSGIPCPMLAQKYDATLNQKGSKNLDKLGLRGKKIHVQAKFDGNRCLIRISNGKAEMFTRGGDLMPVQLDNILRQAEAGYSKYYESGETAEMILDGELFTDKLSFNEANGLLKKFKTQNLEKLSWFNFHIYDFMSEKTYDQRYNIIKRFANDNIKVIHSYEIEATESDIQEKLEEFLNLGHEGLMIRTLDKGYENKRSWSLMKVKVFEDSEYELVDIEEDARGGFIGAFVMKLNKPSKGRDGKEITLFRAGVSGLSQDEGREMLVNKANYIGKMATVEYFGLSEYGVPRFPKLKAFRLDK